jgi:hypothetical protein
LPRPTGLPALHGMTLPSWLVQVLWPRWGFTDLAGTPAQFAKLKQSAHQANL